MKTVPRSLRQLWAFLLKRVAARINSFAYRIIAELCRVGFASQGDKELTQRRSALATAWSIWLISKLKDNEPVEALPILLKSCAQNPNKWAAKILRCLKERPLLCGKYYSQIFVFCSSYEAYQAARKNSTQISDVPVVSIDAFEELHVTARPTPAPASWAVCEKVPLGVGLVFS